LKPYFSDMAIKVFRIVQSKTMNRACIFLFLFEFLFLSVNSYSATSKSDPFTAIDSLKLLVQECPADTCKFAILCGYYWQNIEKNMPQVKHVGKWAYQEIKNSKNLKAFCDGLDILGCIFQSEKKYDSAYLVFQRTLAVSKSIGYHSRTGWSYYHLGIIQSALGRPDSALFYYKILVQFDIENGFSESACDVLNEIAFFFESNKKNDSARTYIAKAIDLSRQIKSINKEIEAHYYFAEFYIGQNKTKNALEHLNTALLLAEKTKNEKAIVSIYYLVGDLFFTHKRNFDIAIQYYLKVLDICPSTNKHLLAAVNNELAKVYLEVKNDSTALKYALTGLSIASSINHKHLTSEAYKNLGNIYFHQSKYAKAINSYTYCYNLGCDECPKIRFHSALLELADSYLKLKDVPKALEYYLKSIQLAAEYNSPGEQALSALKLGNFYRNSDPVLSNKYYKEAYIVAGRSNDLQLRKDITDTLASLYKTINDFKTAFGYQSISKLLSDSLHTIEQQESMTSWEMKLEFEKIYNQNLIHKKISDEEIKRQKAYRNSALLVSLFVLILGWLVWINYKRKKRDYIQLEEQKRQIEEKNQEIQSQVEEITTQKDEIERISNELHQSDENKFRFFTNLSHEFRTPLTLILNPAKNLIDTLPLNGEYKKQVKYIYSNAQKLFDLTNQIMDLQKLDAGMLMLNLEEDDIIEYCVGIISSFESLCDAKRISIHIESVFSSVLTRFDKDKIGKILINLLSNAIKFSFKNSVIEVKLSVNDNSFHLLIHDQGIGIPASEISDVFKRYVQASTNKNTGGTGIGLAYVKELVTFMKGSVLLESTENIGTLVSVEIPIETIEIKNKKSLQLNIAFSDKPKNIKHFDSSEFAGDKPDQSIILIVEDNDQLREFIAKLFHNDYNVLLANNGQDGIETALKNIPDIIISDVMMPLKNGYELCSTLKNDERTSHIPILLLTAKDSTQSSIEGFHTGADDYIIKPFENEILTLKVRNILNTRAAISRQYNTELNRLPNAGAYAEIDKNFMKKCLSVIEKNVDNSAFGVDQLAEALAFSSRNFYRKIKSLTNQTPAELIRVFRLNYAKQLLQNNRMRVSEIAGAVGYDDVKRFSQAFKKQFDVLPSEITH
jgi:signal transduction histidine kinase/DNA-binding response OmpR family regulator